MWNILNLDFILQVLHMKNRSTIEEHHVKGILRVDTVTYRGKTGDNVKRHEFDVVLKPAAKQRVDMLVTFDDYYKRLVDQVRMFYRQQNT